MKNKLKLSLVTLFVFTVLMILYQSCSKGPQSDLAGESLIPVPAHAVSAAGYYTLKKTTGIFVKEGSDELLSLGNYLAESLRRATGFDLPVRAVAEVPGNGGIYLFNNIESSEPTDEYYILSISKKGVRLSAGKAAGIFRGIQTLRQLLPAEIESDSLQPGPWRIACGEIIDRPEYSYRGAMLDVSRHFFKVEDVKRFIDLISYYKLNALHLHLSDDQGWRIEIKSWPNLTAHGGSTQVGGGAGGFYTQEQYSDIVKYAKERYVTIVPEIDMPGHTNAALASYAELNMKGKATELYTGTEVGFSTFDANKEITYKFVDDVVREISELTPGPYFHIGGDESHATKKADYVKFVERVQGIVKAHGKTVIGWDEIATTKLVEGAVAQFWAKAENARMAVGQGARVLFSPANKAYLDMQYDSTTKLGLHWAAYIEVDSSYTWDPAAMVEGVGRENILGIEAPLWSETITNMDEIEYMIFPRLPGIAEIGWTPASKRDWTEYRERLAAFEERFRVMGIDFYKSPRVPWK